MYLSYQEYKEAVVKRAKEMRGNKKSVCIDSIPNHFRDGFTVEEAAVDVMIESDYWEYGTDPV